MSVIFILPSETIFSINGIYSICVSAESTLRYLNQTYTQTDTCNTSKCKYIKNESSFDSIDVKFRLIKILQLN